MKTKKLTKIAVLSALSIVLVSLIHIPIFPAVSFLEYDPADIPILLGTFALGPSAGLILTLLVSLIQGLTVSSASGWYGIAMHLLATGAFSLTAGLIYRKTKDRRHAIFALLFGTLMMTIIMIPANLLLTPVYLTMMYGMTADLAAQTVKGLLLWIAAFNALKAGINSILTFLVYKKVSGLLHS